MNTAGLKGHIPDSVLGQLDEVSSKFGIDSPLRMAHFLAQAAHESGDFKIINENLNYSADGLQKIFHKYFPTPEEAAAYARQPEKIANKVYGNRMGNGDEASGDGYKYHGRGFIQLTGKENYASFTKAIGEDCVAHPELVGTKYPLASAAWFWNKNGLSAIADGGPTEEVVTKITKRVNGGTIGLPDRLKHFQDFHKILAA